VHLNEKKASLGVRTPWLSSCRSLLLKLGT
jgi:hypothetical protein